MARELQEGEGAIFEVKDGRIMGEIVREEGVIKIDRGDRFI
jgi:hypothetical protein